MIKIDKEKNLLFYNTYVPYDCVNSRNFCSQIKSVCKELADVFEKHNIDIEKPWELSPVKLKNTTEYISCQYLVFGECPDDFKMKAGNVIVRKELGNYPSTKGFDQPNFVLDFAITLPNVIKK